MNNFIPKLEIEQYKILEKFINNFFEPTNSKRKNSGNELDYIFTSLDKVFKQNFGFNLHRQHIEETLVKLGFQIFYKNQTYNSDTKIYSPSTDGEITIKMIAMNGRIESPYTYFDIDPKIVRQLMRTTAKLPETTNTNKYYETERMKKKIEEFKKELNKT